MNTSSSFDPDHYKATQRQQWNEAAEARHRWGATLEEWFAQVTAAMLDMTRVGPGNRILDIATGAGEPALSAAEQVGTEGYVLATDLAENIIQYAQHQADQSGLKHFETRVMDGENLELDNESFDVVLCRFGLMFMPNAQRALSEWRRVLKPGGRAAVAVFSSPDKNAWAATPVAIIRRRAQLPPPNPDQPGLFSFAGDGVLENALKTAGFRTVMVQYLSTPLRMPSAEEYVRFARESFGGFNQMMAHLSKEERESVWDEVAEAMKQFETGEGIEVTCTPIVACGVR
jgi:ubiquinone/menaquinone biosynthesis C-methylase UbiE